MMGLQGWELVQKMPVVMLRPGKVELWNRIDANNAKNSGGRRNPMTFQCFLLRTHHKVWIVLWCDHDVMWNEHRTTALVVAKHAISLVTRLHSDRNRKELNKMLWKKMVSCTSKRFIIPFLRICKVYAQPLKSLLGGVR